MATLDIPTAKIFRPLLEPARYKGAWGGRGSGKSHFFAEAAVERHIYKPGTRIVCVREVQRSLKESVKRLVEDKITRLGVGHLFRILNDSIVCPGDGLMLFQGMQDHTAESVKSLEGFDVAYVEEAQTMTSRSLEFLRPTIREPGSELWFSWNPRNASDPVDQLLRGLNPPPDSIVARTSYADNPFFPAVLEEERQHDRIHSPDRYAHIWEGEYEPVVIGAIWSRQILHEGRRAEFPDLERIVVGVDPAVTSPETGLQPDEHGIAVCAEGADGRGYLLEDASLRGTPKQWSTRAVAMYDKWEADAVVIEVNQGGDMCRHTLESVRPGLPIIEVRATRGKHVRAEPISSLYELGMVSHVGTFPELEAQLCKFTGSGYMGEDSPDRAEAAIWAFTNLFPPIVRRTQPENDYDDPQDEIGRSEATGY